MAPILAKGGGAAVEDKPMPKPLFQVAPMMEVTYKDFRQFMRLLTRRAQLWTEMVVDSTLLFSQREGRPLDGFLDFEANEHPIVCQLGGSDPSSLAQAAQLVERWGYDEINLNVGCPSDRVSGKGEFGASLMKRPELVRDCVHAMSRAVQEFSAHFVRTVAQSGCKHFVIHSRKAWLQGLSPAQNRSIPPLHYDRVARLCNEFPDLDFSLNGGITSLERVRGILAAAPQNLVGVMVGRASYENPCMLWDVDRSVYGEAQNPLVAPTRQSVADAYTAYLEEVHPADEAAAEVARTGYTHLALKPILGLFAGVPGNKLFRRTLDATVRNKEVREEGPAAVLRVALEAVRSQNPEHLDAPLQFAGQPTLLDAEFSPVPLQANMPEDLKAGLEGADCQELLSASPPHFEVVPECAV